MKKFKQGLLLGMMVILSRSVLADACYDPTSHQTVASTGESSYDLQGWNWKWQREDAVTSRRIVNNRLYMDDMVFKEASYSPETGLRCTYVAFDIVYGPDMVSAKHENILDLNKQMPIEVDTAHRWFKDPSSPHGFKCVGAANNIDVKSCPFKETSWEIPVG